jgi:hypothetical protein
MQVKISRSKKPRVVSILALRSTLVALASVFFFYWQGLLHSDKPGTARAYVVALQEVRLWWSMFLGMTICLKKLIERFNINSGIGSGLIEPPIQDGYEFDRNTSIQNLSSSTGRDVACYTTWY